jgi:hypothetical protein
MKLNCTGGAPGGQAWMNLFNRVYTLDARQPEWADRIDAELEKFNGINERGSPYVTFATEADALTFILTWG